MLPRVLHRCKRPNIMIIVGRREVWSHKGWLYEYRFLETKSAQNTNKCYPAPDFKLWAFTLESWGMMKITGEIVYNSMTLSSVLSSSHHQLDDIFWCINMNNCPLFMFFSNLSMCCPVTLHIQVRLPLSHSISTFTSIFCHGKHPYMILDWFSLSQDILFRVWSG